ncbi:MAG: hypothetical protein R3F11_19035 [Verrucomicrobiales bacterium]
MKFAPLAAPLLAAAAAATLAIAADDKPAAPTPEPVTAPPAELVEKFGLKPFYKKHLMAGEMPIVASDKVADAALREAAYLIRQMLEGRDDVLAQLAKNNVRFTVMGHDEWTTEVPEHSDLEPKDYWDRRARGLGATKARPSVSCGAENLLCFPGDPYKTENILIHEFAHAIHEMGLNYLDPEFDDRLAGIYRRAMEKGLWKDKYAATNRMEYWAEGVQSYFNTNRENDHDHNHVNTREELKEYDPELFGIIDAEFRNKGFSYQRPAERDEAARAHLADWDPAKSLKVRPYPSA